MAFNWLSCHQIGWGERPGEEVQQSTVQITVGTALWSKRAFRQSWRVAPGKVISCSQDARESAWEDRTESNVCPMSVLCESHCSMLKQYLQEKRTCQRTSLLVQPLGWSALMWRYPVEWRFHGEYLNWKTNGKEKKKIGTGKKSQLSKGKENENRANSPRTAKMGDSAHRLRVRLGTVAWPANEKREKPKKKGPEDPGSQPEKGVHPCWVQECSWHHHGAQWMKWLKATAQTRRDSDIEALYCKRVRSFYGVRKWSYHRNAASVTGGHCWRVVIGQEHESWVTTETAFMQLL